MKSDISKSQQIILTGIPRSGTTLTCHLLNKLPDCVALHEPLTANVLVGQTQTNLISTIDSFFYEQREQILKTGTATSKTFNGHVPDNPRAGLDPLTGKRISVSDGNMLMVSKKLDEHFCLVIKQPVFFTGILEFLVTTNKFDCFAILRNPLAVLLSWNSVDMPVSKGRAPGAEAFSQALKVNLDSINNLYDRQIFLLNWFYQQYLTHLPKKKVIFYEDIINTKGKSLASIIKSAENLEAQLSSKNNNDLYNFDLKDILIKKITQKVDGAFWSFYAKEDIFID